MFYFYFIPYGTTVFAKQNVQMKKKNKRKIMMNKDNLEEFI